MGNALDFRNLALLEEILLKHSPHLLPDVKSLLENKVDQSVRSEMCEAIGKELIANGLDESLEPTPQGLAMEALLDIINRPNLSRNKNIPKG